MDVRGQPLAASLAAGPEASPDASHAVSQAELGQEAVSMVERWLGVTGIPTPATESKLSRLLADERGAQFAIDLTDFVLRPEDLAVAGRNLERVSREFPLHLNWFEGAGTHFAGGFAPLLPSAIVPAAREHFLRSVAHLVLRGDSTQLGKQLAGLAQAGGIRPILAPLSAVSSGEREKHRQLADIHELLRQPGVDAVAIQPAAFLGRPRLIDAPAEVEAAVALLAPLYETAARAERPSLIVLDVTVLDELDITLRVFERMLALYPTLDLGISLPAGLPDSLPALQRVIDLARYRRAGGGAPVTVRFTRGEQFGHERAQALRFGWPPATFDSRAATDAQYLRLLHHALTTENADALTVISATHNLFTVAYAWRLARIRGVERSLQHEFMMGVATAQREAIKRDVGGIRLYVPHVSTGPESLAAPYLKRRLIDLSRGDGHLAVMARLGETAGFDSERESFLAAVTRASDSVARTHRAQRAVRTEVADFTVRFTREWADAVLERTRDSASGEGLLARSAIATAHELDDLVAAACAHGQSWGARRGATRAEVLTSVAELLAEWRGLLVETMVSESAMTLPEADAEVTAAIGLANQAAAGARELDDIREASWHPPGLIVAVTARACPLVTVTGSVLSALGAGSAVVIKTAPETRRTAAVFVETLTAAGVPKGLVTVLDDEGALAEALLRDPRVDHILHSGSRHVAKLFHSWRAEARISSTTGGRNSVIVTPSANLESAVSGIVEGALDHAGQSPTAASTVILVGSVAESARFLGRLTDAIASVPVVLPITTGSGLTALSRPATPSQRRSLETLDAGETWRVQPSELDARGRSWTPGLRDNIAAESTFRKAENRAPVLGIVRARTLAEAIEIQNLYGFGLAAGLYALDDSEIETWLESVEAGVLGVNCVAATNAGAWAPVQGWNRSAMGTVATGGPDSVLTLGEWRPVGIQQGGTVTLDGISEPVARFIAAAQSGMNFEEFDWVRSGALSDERYWQTTFAGAELVNSEFERVEYRYRPVAVTIRLSEGAPAAHLMRVLAAAARTSAALAISTATPLSTDLIELFHDSDSPVAAAEVLVESDVRWHARVQAGELATSRIRLLGGDRDVLARVLHGQAGIAVYADRVTASGRVELLPFLRGQTIRTNRQPLA